MAEATFTPENAPKANQVVDHFFRHEYGKVISIFVGRYGPSHIETIEDSVQDALIKAMQVWPFRQVPHNPSAWIFKVANNGLIDKLRRESRMDHLQIAEDVVKMPSSETMAIPEEGQIEDDMLKMMFACCHPSLSGETQIILTLNLLCGFGAPEIARALVKKREATAKALTRGKLRFKTEVKSLQLPLDDELRTRLKTVMKVVYLLFNEGYKVTQGDTLMDDSLTKEALRLGDLLIRRYEDVSELYALMALMCFQASRFSARTDSHGNLIPMQKQDRALWDRNMITQGREFLELSTGGSYLTDYHIQAGIAAVHCNAASFEETDWPQMLNLYNLQVSHNRLPIAELNRVVPLSKVNGPESGLLELERLSRYPQLLDQHLFYAIKAELLIELGASVAGEEALRKAIELASNHSEKRFLERKLEELH